MKSQTEGKKIEKLYFITGLRIDYDMFLRDNDFTKDQVICIQNKDKLRGLRLEKEQIYKGREWYKICSQDFIDSIIL